MDGSDDGVSVGSLLGLLEGFREGRAVGKEGVVVGRVEG